MLAEVRIVAAWSLRFGVALVPGSRRATSLGRSLSRPQGVELGHQPLVVRLEPLEWGLASVVHWPVVADVLDARGAASHVFSALAGAGRWRSSRVGITGGVAIAPIPRKRRRRLYHLKSSEQATSRFLASFAAPWNAMESSARAAAMADEGVKRAEFYERKAAEARAKADGLKDLEARRTMLLVASMWEDMARTSKGARPG
jgi:hypothetical protein